MNCKPFIALKATLHISHSYSFFSDMNSINGPNCDFLQVKPCIYVYGFSSSTKGRWTVHLAFWLSLHTHHLHGYLPAVWFVMMLENLCIMFKAVAIHLINFSDELWKCWFIIKNYLQPYIFIYKLLPVDSLSSEFCCDCCWKWLQSCLDMWAIDGGPSRLCSLGFLSKNTGVSCHSPINAWKRKKWK